MRKAAPQIRAKVDSGLTVRELDVLHLIDTAFTKARIDLPRFLSQAAQKVTRAHTVKDWQVFLEIDGDVLSLSRHDKPSVGDLGILSALKSPRVADLVCVSRAPQKDIVHFLCSVPIQAGSTISFLYSLEKSEHLQKFASFMEMFGEHIAVYLHNFIYRQRREAEHAAYKAFFDNNLKPSACWSSMLQTLQLFMGGWRSILQIDPQVSQLLIYTEGEENYLRIVAGNDRFDASYVLVDECISGLLIKDRTNDHLLVNPKDYATLYKGYGSTTSRSELAVRLDVGGKPVGIINIEHRDENAFNSLYVQYICEAAKFLAPLVGALQARYNSFRQKEINLLYVFTDMLARMGDAYGHLLSQPLLSCRECLAEIRFLLGPGIPTDATESILLELRKLETALNEIEAHNHDFTRGLPEFISYGPQPLKSKIAHRLRRFEKLLNAEAVDLIIEESPEQLHGYASSLFQEHVFNIVNNSFQQIRLRMFEDKLKKGRIAIGISRVAGKTPQNQQTGINFLQVVVTDNGGGASKKDFAQIGTPAFTTKMEHGSGFGVAAAREYFESIGGEMTWKNVRGGFETTMKLQEFSPSLHKEGRLIDKIRAEARR